LQLNINEATALIASQLQERIRDGRQSVADLMDYGKTLLGRRLVLPGVAERLENIQVEGTFADGSVFSDVVLSRADHTERWYLSVFLVTVHDPICTDDGNLEVALYGSFLPVPSIDVFPAAHRRRGGLPGAIVPKQEPIVINCGREKIKIRVTNDGDRPIQVNLQVDMFS
jgi:urease